MSCFSHGDVVPWEFTSVSAPMPSPTGEGVFVDGLNPAIFAFLLRFVVNVRGLKSWFKTIFARFSVVAPGGAVLVLV